MVGIENRKRPDDDDEEESREIVRLKRTSIAEELGTSEDAIQDYPVSVLEDITEKIKEHNVYNLRAFFKMHEGQFQKVIELKKFDENLMADLLLLRDSISNAASSTTSSNSDIDTSTDTSADNSTSNNNSTTTIASSVPCSQVKGQKIWKIQKLKDMTTGWQEKAKLTVRFAEAGKEFVIIEEHLRPILLQNFVKGLDHIHNYLAILLSASIPEGYFKEQNIKEEQDAVGLFMAKSFATANSKRAYSSVAAESPDKSTRTKRNFYPLPDATKKIIKNLINFSGNDEEFNVCIGWMATKNALITKATGPAALPCPFTYENYNSDMEIQLKENSRMQKSAATQRKSNRVVSNITEISDL